MLYAASEIVFFLLLATLLGVAVGWWMARSDRISVVAAMDRSGAHAAADRELRAARAENAQLAAKLAVATEAIRELELEGHPLLKELEDREPIPETPAAPVELRAVDDVGDGDEDTADEDTADEDIADEELVVEDVTDDDATGTDVTADGETAGDPEVETDTAVGMDVSEDIAPTRRVPRTSKDRGGKRLSERVAEASVFSRKERAAPKIKFGNSDE